jgi:hypothetical protein
MGGCLLNAYRFIGETMTRKGLSTWQSSMDNLAILKGEYPLRTVWCVASASVVGDDGFFLKTVGWGWYTGDQ